MIDYAEEAEEFHCEHIVKQALGLPTTTTVAKRKMSRRKSRIPCGADRRRMASIAAGQLIPQQL